MPLFEYKKYIKPLFIHPSQSDLTLEFFHMQWFIDFFFIPTPMAIFGFKKVLKRNKKIIFFYKKYKKIKYN